MVSAIALERIPFGVRLLADSKFRKGVGVRPAPPAQTRYDPFNANHVLLVDEPETAGVAKRPRAAGERWCYETGERVEVLTDGSCLIDLGNGRQIYRKVVKGKVQD